MQRIPPIVCLLPVLFLPAVAQWTTPVQLTTGAGDDNNPALVNTSTLSFVTGIPEWMAFSRSLAGRKSICVMKTQPGALVWIDSVDCITNDSADNDFPSLARAWFGFAPKLMLVWHSNQSGNYDVYQSQNTGSGWGSPSRLSDHPADDRFPHVAPRDSGFGAVWDRNGSILFAEFIRDTWTPPLSITPQGDSGNSAPQIRYLSWPSQLPMVIWEKRKYPDTTFAVMYSIRYGTTWTSPDTVVWSGDNRGARFGKGGEVMSFIVSWESRLPPLWNIYASGGYCYGGPLNWDFRSEIQSQGSILSDNWDASFTVIPFITKRGSHSQWIFGFATWALEPGLFVAASSWTPGNFTYLSSGAWNRSPEISSGVIDSSFSLRGWSVWAGNPTGSWKLFGSTDAIPLGAVNDDGMNAAEVSLSQNYPNPFNSSTIIEYYLPRTGLVTLKVYDLLGREMRALVQERADPGKHQVRFDADGLPSGVYFCRLQSGDYTSTRKLVVVR